MAQEYTTETIKEIVKLGAFDRGVIDNEDGSKAIVAPNDAKLLHILPAEPKLYRIRASEVFHDVESFNAYVNRFKTPQTQIFAQPGFVADDGKAVVVAVLDYHKAKEGGPNGEPDYGVHQAIYRPRYSDAWDIWNEACGDKFWKQAEFAEFIEENRKDIREPEAAMLIDIISKFKAQRNINFDSLTYQNDGSHMLNYSEDVKQKGSVLLPSKMKLGIPVYFRGEYFGVFVFVRFRVPTGGVVFQLKIDRPDNVENDAFELLLDIIEKGREASTRTVNVDGISQTINIPAITGTGIKPYLGRRGG